MTANKLLINSLRFSFMRQIYLVLTYSGRIMVPRDRGQFGNIITMILLALIVCSAVVLAVYLFLSPTLH